MGVGRLRGATRKAGVKGERGAGRGRRGAECGCCACCPAARRPARRRNAQSCRPLQPQRAGSCPSLASAAERRACCAAAAGSVGCCARGGDGGRGKEGEVKGAGVRVWGARGSWAGSAAAGACARPSTHVLYELGEDEAVNDPPHQAAPQREHVHQARLPPAHVEAVAAKEPKQRPEDVGHGHIGKLKHSKARRVPAPRERQDTGGAHGVLQRAGNKKMPGRGTTPLNARAP